MFRDFKLTFPPVCLEYVKQAYASHQVILEYGSGGSTLLGAEQGSTVVTTETDSKWLVELMGAYQERNLPGKLIPIYADIGPTKAWGRPVDDSEFRRWPDYPQRAWDYLQEHKLHPDLILIDGRFRVASFLTACINIRKPALVLFDDYVERDYYHVVEELYKPVEIIDDRMAVFEIKPKRINQRFIVKNIDYFIDPR
ncbi:hypothetical protein [Salinivibrio proteolyticus]|uniref:hypothetical protein n=1 Tax=Salinivibrio proteolyticus TaxID=334715 RepID=UPI000988C82E|nr:hypothetical protein [Salinivibrio proteolyticus]OOF31685.1 hypothetical protein BZJ20_03795 [Salinivibrio proteolyticus]